MANDPRSLRTALARIRFLGSAKSGTHHSWHMRVTSVALMPLSILFVWILVSLAGKDYNAVRATFADRFLPATVMILFILTSAYHMRLGMQTIIEDYVHDEPIKTWSIIANLLFSVLVGFAGLFAVLKLSLT
ncbi:MAG: succinate dehydrogenase, hydrophobic membrane anchor protein [Beijerinckiaceae bacterium]|jgi:succinate dehydrogenase / fumarate reductase membrane anchor subunit